MITFFLFPISIYNRPGKIVDANDAPPAFRTRKRLSEADSFNSTGNESDNKRQKNGDGNGFSSVGFSNSCFASCTPGFGGASGSGISTDISMKHYSDNGNSDDQEYSPMEGESGGFQFGSGGGFKNSGFKSGGGFGSTNENFSNSGFKNGFSNHPFVDDTFDNGGFPSDDIQNGNGFSNGGFSNSGFTNNIGGFGGIYLF